MRKDSLLYSVPIMIFILVLARSNSVSFAATEATIYVDPPSTYGTSGESFTVDIDVANVVNLYGWQVKMSFNQSVLQVVNITEGVFLLDQPEGTSGESRIENEAGYATFSWMTIGKYNGVDGSGTLATVELHASETAGESVLNITDSNTFLIEMIPPPPPPGEPPYRSIPHVPENGFFTSLVTPPVVEFTSSPMNPSKNELVTFDASASYDDEEIVSYRWDFGDGTTKTYVGTNLTAITTHQYTTSGSKVVTLNVTDNIGLVSVKTGDMWVRFPHDIAIITVEASRTEVDVGETVSIDVTVTNLGDEIESFDVAVYYDGVEIDTETVINLEPDTNEMLTFSWDTGEVATGDYAISAEADVEDEGHPADNVETGGTVTVNPAGEALPMTLIIAVVVIVIAAGVGAFLYMRRKGTPST